jgi:co-chaperonin GroES (HSP10)
MQISTRKELCPEQLPVKPVGYRILIKQQSKSNLSSGGIVLGSDKEAGRQQKGQCFGEVMELGADSYPSDKFPGGPWCKVGDIVRYRAYSGEIFKDENDENVWWHLMNDEDILGVVKRGHEG